MLIKIEFGVDSTRRNAFSISIENWYFLTIQIHMKKRKPSRKSLVTAKSWFNWTICVISYFPWKFYGKTNKNLRSKKFFPSRNCSISSSKIKSVKEFIMQIGIMLKHKYFTYLKIHALLATSSFVNMFSIFQNRDM